MLREAPTESEDLWASNIMVLPAAGGGGSLEPGLLLGKLLRGLGFQGLSIKGLEIGV